MQDESNTEGSIEQIPDDDAVQSSNAALLKELESRLPRMSTRYFAATMDNAFLVVAFLIAGGVLGEWLGRIQNETLAIILGIGLYTLSLFYFLIPEWRFGATPGKYWMGLQVVKVDGTPCTFKSALIRTLWRLIEANPFTLLPAGLMIFFTPHGRRIGDYQAGTIVVKSRKRRG